MTSHRGVLFTQSTHFTTVLYYELIEAKAKFAPSQVSSVTLACMKFKFSAALSKPDSCLPG